MVRGTVRGRPFRKAIWFGTESTEFDMDKNLDLLPLARDAGMRAIWFGIEDMTAELVKKGQESGENPARLPGAARPRHRPDADDDAPRRPAALVAQGLYGLLNQVQFLKRAGAVSAMITFLTPSVGSRGYEQSFQDGLVLRRVGNRTIEDRHFDGNHCIATKTARPWRKQLNMLIGYAVFYNPIRALKALFTFDALWKYRTVYQVFGNLGVIGSTWKTLGWLRRLATGRIEQPAGRAGAEVPHGGTVHSARHDHPRRIDAVGWIPPKWGDSRCQMTDAR